jgi:ornithine lipid ester-linked acyl 2-hydroxylase
MHSERVEPWFFHDGGPFKGREPFYFDTSRFPWVERIESQWTVIRDELMVLVGERENSLVPYAIDGLTSKPNHWKTFGLMFWKVPSRENCRKCPKTWGLLSSIPNVLAGSFNLLEPGTTIKPHHGDTNAIIRCHLGLVIPGPAPQCAFRVGAEVRGWQEGKILMFCDAHVHTGWNNTEGRRYIMVIDIMRPEYAARTKSICSRVLAYLNLELAYQRREWLRRRWRGKRAKALIFRLLKAYFHLALHARLPLNPLPS